MSDFEKWKALLLGGALNRRDFLAGAAALAGTAGLSAGLAPRAAHAEPKRGGHMRLGLGSGSTNDTLNPWNYPDAFTTMLGYGCLGNCLVEVDAEGNAVGDLAESFAASDDQKTWTFRLREGLSFHDGRPVRAEDVVASIRFHMTPESTSAAKSLLANITDITATEAGEVVFVLGDGATDFPYFLATVLLVIMPSEGGVVDWQSGIRTGPFVLEEFEPGVRAKLRRFEGYHKPGLPYADSCELLSIPDTTARTNALLSGDVHYVDRLDMRTLGLLGRKPDIRILNIPGYAHYYFSMLNDVPPFDDPNVRMALKYAIDREDILAKVLQGYGSVGNDNPIAASVKYAVDPQPVHSYDPDTAREWLKKSGLESLTVDLHVAEVGFPGCIDAAVLFKEHAAKAGIDINVIREPSDGYWDNVWLKKGFCATYSDGRPSCDWNFSVFYAADAAWNDSRWKNAEFDAMLAEGRALPDGEERAALYAKMQDLVQKDGGNIIVAFNDFVCAHSDAIDHGAVVGFPLSDGYRITSRWWFS